MDELFSMLMGDDDDIDMQLHQNDQQRKSRRKGRSRRKRKYNSSNDMALIHVQGKKDQPRALIRVHSQSKRQKTRKTRRVPFFRRRKQQQQKEEDYWEEEESWDDAEDYDYDYEEEYEDIDDVEESEVEKENNKYEDIEDEDEQEKENKHPTSTYHKPKFIYQPPNLEPEISTPSFSAASSMSRHLVLRKDPSYQLNRTSTIKSIGSRSELHCQRTVTTPGLTKSLSQGSTTMQKGLASDASSTRSLSSIQSSTMRSNVRNKAPTTPGLTKSLSQGSTTMQKGLASDSSSTRSLSSIQSSTKRSNVRNKAPTSFQTYRNGQLIVASFRKQK